MSEPIEWIRSGDEVLGIIIRSSCRPEKTEFLTPDDYNQQVGFVVHPAGTEISSHFHLAVKRSFEVTTEVLFLRSGRASIDFYGSNRVFVTSRELAPGDAVALTGGGHGIRFIEDSVFLEIKQGPYVGPAEKQTFVPRQ